MGRIKFGDSILCAFFGIIPVLTQKDKIAMNMMTIATIFLFAAKRAPLELDVGLFTHIAFIVIALIVLAIVAINNSVQKEKRNAVQSDIDRYHAVVFKKWHNAVMNSGEIQPTACNLILDKGEECLWIEHSATLYEVRTVRHATHTFGSTSIGNDVRIGSGYSTGESTDEWRPIAEGQLYVTNKQIYFDGDKFDRKIPIKKIATIKADWSAVEISTDTGQKSTVFFGVNGNIIRESVLCAAGQDVFTHLLT